MRKLILPTILFIIAIASFFWYTKPTYEGVTTLQEDIADIETSLEQINEMQQIRDDLLTQYNQLPENGLYILNRMLPDSLDPVRFIIEMDRIAATNGLTVQDLSVSGSSGDSGGASDDEGGSSGSYESTDVSFSITATYEEALDFAQDIERSARLLSITKLDVSSAAGDSSEDSNISPGGSQNQYSFTARTYWLNEES